MNSDCICTDVLVLGAGAAGLRAAIASCEVGAEVIIVSNCSIGTGGSSFSARSKALGFQSLFGEKRSPALGEFYQEILDVGQGCAVPELARILVEESGPRMKDLLEYGLLLKKTNKGEPLRVKGCFSDIPRAFVTESLENLQATFLSKLEHLAVKFITGVPLELICRDGTCWGAWILTSDGRLVAVRAGGTVLATGGGSGVFSPCLSPQSQLGEGLALAVEAGAEHSNLEFIQFMLVYKERGDIQFLPPEHLTPNGLLLNKDGCDLLKQTIPRQADRECALIERKKHFPFSSLDNSWIIDAAIAAELKKGSQVWWSGKTVSGEPVEVMHAAHAFNGGLVIDDRASTTIPGLFAAGEIAAGPHGANRIGGCMMTATQVFGKRAGEHAGVRCRARTKLPAPGSSPAIFQYRGSRSTCLEAEYKLGTARGHIMAALGPLRSEQDLISFLQMLRTELRDIESTGWRDLRDLRSFLRARAALHTALLITSSSLDRRSSLGPHVRTDKQLSVIQDLHSTSPAIKGVQASC